MIRTNSGFSLVEIMVVLAIVGLLSGLAYPTYTRYWVHSKRLEGRLALLRTSALLEDYAMLHDSSYLGASLDALGIDSKEGSWYSLHIEKLAHDYYQLRANPSFKDSECTELRCDSKGQYSHKGSGSYQDCWGGH